MEKEGVEYIFGLPGEENIAVIEALTHSKIRFILARHEQGASFMADIYGRLARKAGVCLATLGPGAINLLLGTADAKLDSSPLVALAAQASMDRLSKESHQIIDLNALFQPITKWSSMITLPEVTPEILRKAFKIAQTDRPGPTAIVIPEDIAAEKVTLKPLPVAQPKPTLPSQEQLERAAKIINAAKNPVILVGNGVCRYEASYELTHFAETSHIPAATTFMAKGVISDANPLAMGTIGFMRHDYTNFGLDKADVVIAVGYDLVEYDPKAWNPGQDKQIIHIHTTPAEVDNAYSVAVGIQGDIGTTLEALSKLISPRQNIMTEAMLSRNFIQKELENHAQAPAFPLKPQRIVSDIRAALSESDILLCDTGALKMWMARLYPCYQPDTCLFSNGLSTMGFSLPGAIAAKLVHPDRKVLVATGDGSFLMNSQELETAKREKTPFVILIWRDEAYGLIEWKQNLVYGHSAHIKFTNPDFIEYAKSFGIPARTIHKADELLPCLKEALESNELFIIDCPVDYSENINLTNKLGLLTKAL